MLHTTLWTVRRSGRSQGGTSPFLVRTTQFTGNKNWTDTFQKRRKLLPFYATRNPRRTRCHLHRGESWNYERRFYSNLIFVFVTVWNWTVGVRTWCHYHRKINLGRKTYIYNSYKPSAHWSHRKQITLSLPLPLTPPTPTPPNKRPFPWMLHKTTADNHKR